MQNAPILHKNMLSITVYHKRCNPDRIPNRD